jgi:hypothetical protein
MQFSKNNTKLKKTIKLIKELGLDLPYRFLIWGLPAFKTTDGQTICPGAGACVGPCFARSGHYLFKRRKEIEHANYTSTQDTNFTSMMIYKLRHLPRTLIRLHDSGDFYNEKYFLQWLGIADCAPHHVFYAYTKSWEETQYYRYLHKNYKLPHNFKIVYSYGGKHDDELHNYNYTNSRQLHTSKIFLTDAAAIQQNYKPSPTDLDAIIGVEKIGLIYHNNKHHRNFKWTEGGALYNS